MYAIIQSGGKQYRVSEGDVINVELLKDQEGNVEFEPLFVNDGQNLTVGDPVVTGWTVKGEVLGCTKGKKLTFLKFKRRCNQRRRFGHRQHYTQVKITGIQGA